MVTGATLHKAKLFSTEVKLTMLEHDLLALAKQHHWQLEAWAVFVNHYPFIARGLLMRCRSVHSSINCIQTLPAI